jgi:hypothetical protein
VSGTELRTLHQYGLQNTLPHFVSAYKVTCEGRKWIVLSPMAGFYGDDESSCSLEVENIMTI